MNEALYDEMARSGELDALTSRIDVNDMNSILAFGADAAARIGAASDAALADMARPRPGDSGAWLEELAGIMARLGGEERRPGLLGRLLGRREATLDETLEDYDAMAGRLERIYALLKGYQQGLLADERRLEALEKGVSADALALEKYVVAGEQGCREIGDYLAQRQAAGDDFEVQTLRQALAALQRRVADLRQAGIVAGQTVAMLRTVGMNDRTLAQRIDAAFLVTLPLFRVTLNALAEQKRRRLREAAMAAVRAEAPGDREALQAPRRQVLEGIGQVRALEAEADRQREAARRMRG